MTHLIELFLNKLYAYLDRSSFYTLSPHVVGSIVATATQLRAHSCISQLDAAEISNELVLTTLSNAVIDLLQRHPTPPQPNNINQRLIAAFSLVINQFYDPDPVRRQDAKQIFASTIRIDYRTLGRLEIAFCDALNFAISLNRDAEGKLAAYPSLAIDDHARKHLIAMNGLEREVLESLRLAPGGNFNLQRHYEFIACEFWPVFFEAIPQDAFLTHVANLMEDQPAALLLKLLKTSSAFDKLLILLVRLNVEKIAHAYIEQLSVHAPYPDFNQLPEDCLSELSYEITEKYGIHLYGSYLQQDHAGFAAYCKLILPMQVNFCYLIVLNHLRTAIWKHAVLPFFHHDRNYLERVITELSSSIIATQLPWERIIEEIRALIRQSSPAESIEELLYNYAMQSYPRQPLYARMITRGILHDFLTNIRNYLPYSHRSAEGLFKRISAKINGEYKDADADIESETKLHQHFHDLLWTYKMTESDISRVLARAFWRAAEHEPTVGFELLVRFYMILNYSQPNYFEQWDEQARRIHTTIVHNWHKQNAEKLKPKDKALLQAFYAKFWNVFEEHLKNPQIEHDNIPQNVHNHDLDALQDSLCRIWLSASVPAATSTTAPTPHMGQGR